MHKGETFLAHFCSELFVPMLCVDTYWKSIIMRQLKYSITLVRAIKLKFAYIHISISISMFNEKGEKMVKYFPRVSW